MRKVQLPGFRLKGGQKDSYSLNIGTGVYTSCHVGIDRNLRGCSHAPVLAVGRCLPATEGGIKWRAAVGSRSFENRRHLQLDP